MSAPPRMSPLIIRYDTSSGNHYVFDVCSSEILRIDDVVNLIIEDYGILTDDEIVAKHHAVSETAIRTAISQIAEMQSQGLLRPHYPTATVRVSSASIGEEPPEPIHDFLASRRRLLTLEVTHRCNLACDYCCFGEDYDKSRRESEAPMSFEVAKQAVSQFLSHKPKYAGIGFYGGEPLLEFELIKKVVLFAEESAASNDMDVKFSMTTNGTLLSDDKIHFLVAHHFSVMISLDGSAESHDRYRVFKKSGKAGERRGSFDVIKRNLDRFVELYPDYRSRGFVVTLTATSDLVECEEFLADWMEFFPVPACNFVESIPSGENNLLGIGCWQKEGCGETLCRRPHGRDDDRNEIQAADATRRLDGAPPPYANWTEDFRRMYRAFRHRYTSQLCSIAPGEKGSLEGEMEIYDLRNSFPINQSVFEGLARSIHKREMVGKKHPRPTTRMACFPGATRTYCSLDGTLYSCEKTEFGDSFALGSVASDIDADRAYRLSEIVRLHCDCANCVASRTCTLCPAEAKASKELPGRLDSQRLRGVCRTFSWMRSLSAQLSEYTEIMEKNPSVLDRLFEGETILNDDWLDHVKLFSERRSRVELSTESLEGF